jgi:hypothetical protein
MLSLPKKRGVVPARPPAVEQETMYDAVCYGARMVAAMERLLLPPAAAAGGAVTLHHRKIIMKDRTSGGAGAPAAGAADGAGRPVPSLWPVGFRHFLARLFDSYPLLK